MDSLDSLIIIETPFTYFLLTYLSLLMGPYYNLSCEGILSVLRKSINIYIKTVDFNILDKPFFFFFTWFICYFLEGIWNVEYIETPKIGKFTNRRLMIM